MNKKYSVCVIVPAAGKGTRTGMDINKVYALLGDTSILARSILPFLELSVVKQVVVAISPADTQLFDKVVLGDKKVRQHKERIITVCGGTTRGESVYNSLSVVGSESTLIAVHDGARPFIKGEDITKVLDKANETGAACLGVKVKDTIKRVAKVAKDLVVTETLDRNELVAVQTPQVFHRKVLIEAYEKAIAESFQGSDDAVLVENTGLPVTVVLGSYDNLKITTLEDFIFAEGMLAREKC